jgi:hypothetical protein
MTRLENWSVRTTGDGYTSPEYQTPYLAGTVFNHPNSSRYYDGKDVVTSRIVEIDKETRTVITYSGTRYVLGKPDEMYLQWLEAEGRYCGEDVFPSFV